MLEAAAILQSGAQQGLDALLETRIGTPAWMAPEVLRGERYSFSADVYSFGVVLW